MNDSRRPAAAMPTASIGKIRAGRDSNLYFDYSTTIHQVGGSLGASVEAESGLVVVGAVPRQAPHFVDRTQSGQLHDALRDNRVAVVVCGMRGAGKTQVAAAYARGVIDAGGPGLVGWVNAETHSSIVSGLAAIANRLRVADSDGDSLVSAHRLRDHLNSRPELPGVLVFDNAADPDFLAEFLPTSGRVRVVITSIDRTFTWFGRTIDTAAGFDRPESVQYLRESTGLEDPGGADAVAAEVGDLPLALSVAAATITRRRLDYKEYRRLLAAQPLPTALPKQRGSGYELAVDQALRLAVDTVTTATSDEAVDEPVRWLVEVMAMLSPDGVEAALLPDSDPPVGAAIDRCVQGSLVSWSTLDRVLVMHRLIGRVILERAQATGKLDTFAATAAKVLAPHLFDPDEAFRRRAEGTRLVDHIETLSGIIDRYPPFSAETHAAVLGMRRWATRQLIEAADLNRAISLAERTHTDHRHRLGPDHPDTLTSRHHLAGAYREVGRVAEAITLYEQLITDYRRVLGEDHPDTLATRHNLAYAYQEAGRIAEAITLYQQTLGERQRLLGEDHLDTLTSRHHLAGAYQEARRVTEAITLYEQLITDYRRVLGEDHPSTLAIRVNLAGAYREAGRIAEAITLYEQLVAAHQRVLGGDHPDTLATHHNLAYAYQEAGRVTEAITLYEQLITDYRRVLGEDHPSTLTSRHHLAYAYQEAGRIAEAITLYEQTLADCRRVLDPDHPLIARTGDSLAAIRKQQR